MGDTKTTSWKVGTGRSTSSSKWMVFGAVGFAMVMIVSIGAVSVTMGAAALAQSHGKIGANAEASAAATALTAMMHPTGGKATPHMSASIIHTTSGNWAGAAAVANSPGTITEISAEWFVPTASCSESSGATYQVEWVGIDGFGSGSVEQAGSFDYCSGPGATPAYYSWWEFYPYNSVQIYAGTTAGAFISAYVLYNPAEEVNGVTGVYTVGLFDVDNGVSFSVVMGGWNLGYTPADSSAECISEAPGISTGTAPLADYGTTTIYACDTTIGTHSNGIGFQGTYDQPYVINQVQAHQDQKVGTLFNYFGQKSSFSITWENYN